MFVADVKCSQAAWQTVPNSRTGSAKASVSERGTDSETVLRDAVIDRTMSLATSATAAEWK